MRAAGSLFWQTFSPLPLLGAMSAAEAVIKYFGRGRIPNPPRYTAADWHVPADAEA